MTRHNGLKPVQYIVVLLIVTLFGVLCVAQQAHVVHLGCDVRRLEGERALLAEQNRRLLCEISALTHPTRIAGEVERLSIGMLDPVALTQASKAEDPGKHIGRTRP
jgi:hypothetical protein